MTINTDLNVPPYFSDYDEDKQYYHHLFKPATAVQTRELNNLQAMLLKQVERFGDNVLVEGSIVSGGGFKSDKKLAYVKISDNNTSGQKVIMSNYEGASLRGKNSGITAYVVKTLEGYETQSPDLNTLYVKYTSSGKNSSGEDIKTFLPGEIIEVTVDGNIVDDLEIAVVTLSVDSAPIGVGFSVSCGDGVLYQKGMFLNFLPQTLIVEKYHNEPDNLFVGFLTEEEVIDANTDITLNDNAQGYNNYNAPGADRLKLIPTLVVYTKEVAETDEHFFPILEYQDGKVVRRNTTTQFNSVSKMVEERTAEESGDYFIDDYEIRFENNGYDSEKIDVIVGRGLAYVNGKRVEILNDMSLTIDKAIDTNRVEQQNVLANYGNYVLVQNFKGVFDFENFQFVNLRIAVQTATSLVGFTPVGTVIGQARVKSVERVDSSTYRVYLSIIKMNSGRTFSEVRSMTNSNSGFGNLILENGKAVIKESNFNKLYFPVGKSFIKSIDYEQSDYIAKKKIAVSIGTSGSFNIALPSNELFPYGGNVTLNSTNLSSIIISDDNNGNIFTPVSGSTDATGTVLTLSIGAIASAITANVILNVKRINIKPSGKELKTVYLRINPTGNTDDIFHLGWPDVYSIEGIWQGPNLTFTENSAGIFDVKEKFTLHRNVREDYYDISYLRKKNLTLGANDRLLVKAKVFVKTTTGSFGQSFFSIDSYPIDDVSTVLPDNKIRTYQISNFDGDNMRNFIDFRLFPSNNAVYAETAGAASAWTLATPLSDITFISANTNLIAPNATLELAYDYYLSRKDCVVIDSKGEPVVIQGISSEEPTYPEIPAKNMCIARLNIPAYPSLPSNVANRAGTPEYGISFSKEGNRGYTMKDIGDIEKRLERIEYYTILNALEKSAEDMVVKDADGLNRFKNGILVDNFNNLLIGKTKDDDFNASVDPQQNELTPKFRSYTLGLKYSSGANLYNTDETSLLNFTTKKIISQPYASRIRNCVTDFYNYAGEAYVWPEYDSGPETTRAPDININIDLATPFIEFTEKLAEFVPLTSSTQKITSEVVGTSTSNTVSGNIQTSTTTTETLKTITKDIEKLTINSSKSTQKVGDFVSNVEFSPYMRSKVLRIHAEGLKPNTRFYFYFDNKPVGSHVASAILDSVNLSEMKRTSGFGEQNYYNSDADGVLSVMFKIPESTFLVGDREFMIVDVDDIRYLDAATSSAIVTYSGFNFSVEKTGLEVSTRKPSFDIKKSKKVTKKRETTSTTSTSVISVPFRGSDNDDDSDPIAQTFKISDSMSDDTHVMITSVKVAFKTKSSKRGITLHLRKTVNGYPSAETVPFGAVSKKHTEVSVSENGSVFTTFNFKTPVTLKTGEEYAVVLIPKANDPDYNVWVAKTGEPDVRTGVKMTKDVSSGTLFTSTNNSAWTAYQSENLKYEIEKCVFSSANGQLNITNEDHEFLDLTTYSKNFQGGEVVFKVNAFATGTVSTIKGSNVVSGVGTAFNTLFSVGDYIAIRGTAENYEIAKILEINSPTSIIVNEIIKFTSTNRSYFKTIVGEVEYFNRREPVRLILKNSSAKNGQLFENGDIVRGEITEAVAEIGNVINLPVSYMQPNIYRTNFKNTKTKLEMTTQSSNVSRSTAVTKLKIDDTNYMRNIDTVIKSRSNEIRENSGAKSFMMRVTLDNISAGIKSTSPVVDYGISSMTTFEYLVNPLDTTILNSEKGSNGLCESKYISKTVTLAEGFDAEDLKVWLTGYRPVGTDISVMIKFKSLNDPTSFDEIPWTSLKMNDNKNFFSSTANMLDFKEFECEMRSTVLGNGEGAYLNNGNFEYKSKDGVIYNNYKYFAVKILLNSDTQKSIPRVDDYRALALT